MMKILLVTENGYCGGLDSFIVSLINHWPHADDHLLLACNASHPGLETVRRRTIRPLRIIAHDFPLPWTAEDTKRGRLARLLQAPWRIVSRQWMFLDLVARYGRLIEQEQPDRLLVVNGGYPAGLSCRAATVAWGRWAKKHGKPAAIHNFHNFAVPPRWWESPFENAIDHLVHRHSRAVISVSAICADSIRIRRAFRQSDRVAFIHNGIEPPRADATESDIRAELKLPADASIGLMLGTYEPRKGHAFLLQAFAKIQRQVPLAHLVICGFGYPADVDRVRRLVAEHGLSDRVHLQPFRHDVDSLIRQATLLLAPSLAFESFGLTIVEAMARAVPVIAARTGGIPEVLPHGHAGFLVEAGDVDDLAQRMTELLSDPQLRAQLGQKGHQIYEAQFQAARMAADYARLVRAD